MSSWKELEEWLKSDRTIQELKAKAKELGLTVKKQMGKNDVRKMLERFLERSKLVIEGVISSSSPSQVKSSQKSANVIPSKEDLTLPETYNKNKLVAMPVNPYWIHFYWDLSGDNQSLLRSKEVLRVVLRVYDVTYIEFDGTNAHRTFEILIDPFNMKNYYVNVPTTGAHYLGEIGYYDTEGQYKVLIRSNLCKTPTNAPSQSTRERWLDLRKKRRIVMPSSGMITPIVERISGSVQGLEQLFRISGAGSFSVNRFSGKGL
ncbi:MAG: DUF4912 domain-containing protein [Fervidobacterium sp.]|jgi:hypothetical protein